MLPIAGCKEILLARSSVSDAAKAVGDEPGGGRLVGWDVVASIGRRGVRMERWRGWERFEILLGGQLGVYEGREVNDRCGADERVMHGRKSVDALVAGRATLRRQLKAFIVSSNAQVPPLQAKKRKVAAVSAVHLSTPSGGPQPPVQSR